MSGSPSFAFEVLACTLAGIVLWAACAGVGFGVLGRRVAAAADTDAAVETEAALAGWRQPGVAACIGLGVLMLLGGLAVAIRLPWWLVTAPFIVVGLALGFREISGANLPRPTGRVAVIGAITIGVFVAVAAVEAVVGFRFPLHPWDDMRAYLPMAHRLIETNGLEEAWNARRLQTVGGFTFIQALPVAIFGDDSIGVIETMLASIFLAGLFVANGVRTTWARVVSIAFIVAIPFFWVPRINTTGVLMGTSLLVAVLAITVHVRRALRADDSRDVWRWSIGGGLVIAALMSVRPNLGLLGALYVAGGTLVVMGIAFRARIAALGIAAGATILALLPWSIASLRAVSTPFYLLDPGNQNPKPIRLRAATGLADTVEHAVDLLRSGPYLWVVLVALVVVLVARKLLPDPSFAVIAVVATGLVMAGVAWRGYTMADIAFVRYTAPMTEGLAVFLFCEFLRSADARSRAKEAAHRAWTAGVVGLVAAAGLVVVSYSSLGMSLVYPTGPGGWTLVSRALNNDLVPRAGWELTSPRLRAQYRRAMSRVDPDRTIAAVDRPYLIDTSRFDIPNMDLPGFTAPDGKFPFLTGPGPKVARLREAGYDTLIATAPSSDIALAPAGLYNVINARIPAYSPTARFYLDWEQDVDEIARLAPTAVQRFGSLLVIDLARAERDIARATGSGSTP